MTFLDTGNVAITVMLVILALYIAYQVERKHKARVQFDLEAICFAAQKGHYIVELTLVINNKGLVRHVVDTLNLKILGIKNDTHIEIRKIEGINSVADFPELFIDTDLLANKGQFFIEPDVVQKITYIARIPEDIRLILVRSNFKYQLNSTHSVQKVFELKAK